MSARTPEQRQNNQNNQNKLIYYAVLAVIALIGVLFAVSCFQQKGLHRNNNFSSSVAVFQDGWDLYGENGGLIAENIDIYETWPDVGPSFSLSRRLPETDMPGGQTPSLLITPYYTQIDICVNGRVIRSYSPPKNAASSTEGTATLLVPLPGDWKGQELTLRCAALLDGKISQSMRPPLLGLSSDILYYVVKNEFVAIMGDILLFFLGLLLIFVGVIFPNKSGTSRHIITVGVFVLMFGVYDLTLTRTLHILIDNNYGLYVLEMLTLAAIAAPFLLLVQECADQRLSKWIDGGILLTLANVAGQILLHLFTPLEFRQMLPVTHAILMLNIVLTLFAVLRPSKRKIRQKQFLLSVTPLLIGAVCDLVRFYMTWSTPLNVLFRVGAILFVLVQISFTCISYLNIYKRSIESNFYHEMAYHDELTGLCNRAAYRRDVDLLANHIHSFDSLWCVSVDINNLKLTNDTLGHLAGDDLIQRAAHVFNETVGFSNDPARLGNSYRTGGDEFILLIPNMTEKELEELIGRIQDHPLTAASEGRQPLSLSVGASPYLLEDEGDLDKMFSRADVKMYHQKQVIKHNSHTELNADLQEQAEQICQQERKSVSHFTHTSENTGPLPNRKNSHTAENRR